MVYEYSENVPVVVYGKGELCHCYYRICPKCVDMSLLIKQQRYLNIRETNRMLHAKNVGVCG